MTVRFISSDNNILLIGTIKSVRRDLCNQQHLNHQVLAISRTQYIYHIKLYIYIIVFIKRERALARYK